MQSHLTRIDQAVNRLIKAVNPLRSLLLLFLFTLGVSEAFAISTTGPTAANPFSLIGSSTPLYFSSPAEAGLYLAAADNKISISEIGVAIYTYVGAVGPYTSPSPCSASQPCYLNEGIIAPPGGNPTLTPFGAVQNLGGPGTVCPDGSFAPQGQTCAAKSLGLCSCGVADPIDVGSGNVYYQTADYATYGPNKLQFVRYYNSRQSNSLANTLGALWRSTYDRYIRISSATSVFLERPDGRQLQFTLASGVWTHDTDVDITLTQSGSTWTLTDHDDTVEAYTTNAAGTAGILQSIKGRNGYTQTLTYNSSSQLASVEDSYGRSLFFTYKGGLIESVETPEATSISYGYTSVANGSNLTTVTYPTSTPSTVTYLYGNTALINALTGIIDEDNNRYETWTYDNYSRGLTNSQGTSGLNANLTTITYNDTTGSRTVENALGVVDTYSFTVLQGIPKVTQISRAKTSTTAAATEAFGYDTNGYLSSNTDWNGNKTTFTNDAHGDPTTINEAVGTTVSRTTTIVYDSPWVHLPASITTSGLTTTFTYDSVGEMLTKTLTDTTTTTTPYSTKGQTRTWTNTWSNALLASIKTPNGNTTKYGYDGTGALTSTTDAAGHVTKITSHTGGGLPKVIVDPNAVTTTLTYNPRQWLVSSEISGTGGSYTTALTYDAAGNLTRTTLPDGSYTQTIYDTAHRPTGVTDALGNYTEYTLDAFGDRTESKIYNKGATAASWTRSGTFDALGRLLVDTAGAGQTTTRTYDPNGNVLSVTDGLKHETIDTYDALNRPATSTDANSGVTTTTYDTHNRVVSVKDANGNTTSYARDGFGDVIQQVSPDSGKTVFHYDGDGNLTSKTDALSIVTNQTFDSLDRRLKTTYPADAAENVAYTYDQSGTGFTFGVGRLTSVTDAAGTLSRDYDERGNLSSEVRVNGKTTLTTKYTYDGASRVASMTYPDGTLVAYSRNTAGYVSKVSATLPGAKAATTLAVTGHLPFGPINSVTYGNGIAETWSFDAAYRSTGITDTLSGTNLQKLTYGYDVANNLKTITDAVNAANTQTLGYDVINRLTSAASGTGGYGTYGWTYDKVDNRLTQTLGSVTTKYAYASGTNRLADVGSTAVSTNANGNITSIPPANSTASATFAYNNANRLASVVGSPMAATFVYDWQGQRFSKTNPGTTPTLFSYMQGGTLIEENDNGTLTDYVYADGRPIADLQPSTKVTANQVNYLLDDRLGTPQSAVNSAGATVWRTTYQPFGTTGLVTASITQSLRLPGQYADPETGFSYNLNRDYMPNLGRYPESDPIGLRAGLNTYVYVSANPLVTTDSQGLCAAIPWDDFFNGIETGTMELPGWVADLISGAAGGAILSLIPTSTASPADDDAPQVNLHSTEDGGSPTPAPTPTPPYSFPVPSLPPLGPATDGPRLPPLDTPPVTNGGNQSGDTGRQIDSGYPQNPGTNPPISKGPNKMTR